MNKVLITGMAGFIGFHLAKELQNEGYYVVGIDNINDYYDVELKKNRLKQLKKLDNIVFYKMDLNDKKRIDELFFREQFDYVINLAAQAGVRYSLENPYAYIDSNVMGFLNVLEACRNNPIKHLLYASSSSVYGGNKEVPFSVDHQVDHPVSLYAATKKSNELMAHTYSHLFDIPSTGLRFFTVYGPYGRPDMAYFSFTKAIIEGESINVFNHGKMERDFTFVGDIVEGICKLLTEIPKGCNDPTNRKAPYVIHNIGNNAPVKLGEFISVIENKLGLEAEKNYVDMQPGDVKRTYADVSALEKSIGFKPSTSLEAGIGLFVDWYKDYYKV